MAALWLDAESVFLSVATLALLPAAASIVAERKFGFLSNAALVTGVVSLTMAAPVVAAAGGAGWPQNATLFGLLSVVFCWRTMRVAKPLQAGAAWDRNELRARGLREAAITAVWTLAVVVALRAGFV
jgi:hypothetical protein